MARMKSQLSLASGTEVKRLLRRNLILLAIIALETITLFGFTMTNPQSLVCILLPRPLE
jgi:hypothetical protein